MKQLLTPIILFAFLSVMSGCATSGKNFSSAGVKQLAIGKTTEKEAITAFGEPIKRQERSENDNQFLLLTYGYAEATANSSKGRRLTTEFKNGILNAYLFFSALEGDSTDFDLNAVSKAQEKILTVDEIVSLLGRPSGEVRLPSLLLKTELGSMPEGIPPANASSAILYAYTEVKKENKIIMRYVKLFVVYMKADGSVIEKRHFNGTL